MPSEWFAELAAETKVNHQVKKLDGETVFKLILFSLLNGQKTSLRVMEEFLASASFQALHHTPACKFNSIRDRICTIKADYFAKLFTRIAQRYQQQLGTTAEAVAIVDSTIVSLSAALLTAGMKTNQCDNLRAVKFSLRLVGTLPTHATVHTAQEDVGDEAALVKLIDHAPKERRILLFDRGVNSRKTFDRFTGENCRFISRLRPSSHLDKLEDLPLTPKPAGATLTIIADQRARLHGTNYRTKHRYRVITAVTAAGEPLRFVTNITELSAWDIAALYKQRWQIEVFFKFLKQHLNFKHFISRQPNGISVMLYMTLMLAILLTAYRHFHPSLSMKIAKLRFAIALDNELTKQIVILCGGDPNRAPHLWRQV